MNDKHKYSVDVNRLIDWEQQRVQINERISSGGAVRVHRGLKWAFVSAVAAAILAAVIFWPFHRTEVERREAFEEYYSQFELNVSAVDYVPRSLYVLNGFDEEETDFEETVNYIVPSNGEEDL